MDLALRHSIEKHFILKDVFHNYEPSSSQGDLQPSELETWKRGWGWGWGGEGGMTKT